MTCVLVADLGGTNARFALSYASRGQIILRDSQVVRAEDFETLIDAARAYLEEVQEAPDVACFAVAGPVTDATVKFSNSHWVLDKDSLAQALSLRDLVVVNDFFALASAIPLLPTTAFYSVHSMPKQPQLPQLVIGAGTGWGQAILVPGGAHYKVIATEGGHVAFAPSTEHEIAVMRCIAADHPRVSVERLLSGAGLVNIHRALCQLSDQPYHYLKPGDITEAALLGTDPLARETLDLFCAVLGRVAGDAVLATGARGGVVLGGGILPKIQDAFLTSSFMDCFLDKGRMQHYVEAVPVDLLLQDLASLHGAASILLSPEI